MVAHQEDRFKRRVRLYLEEHGYVVIVCARSKPIDLVACKNGHAYLIELKAKQTIYPKEQQEMQGKLALKAGMTLAIIKQSKKERGKIELELSCGDEHHHKMLTFSLRQLLWKKT